MLFRISRIHQCMDCMQMMSQNHRNRNAPSAEVNPYLQNIYIAFIDCPLPEVGDRCQEDGDVNPLGLLLTELRGTSSQLSSSIEFTAYHVAPATWGCVILIDWSYQGVYAICDVGQNLRHVAGFHQNDMHFKKPFFSGKKNHQKIWFIKMFDKTSPTGIDGWQKRARWIYFLHLN